MYNNLYILKCVRKISVRFSFYGTANSWRVFFFNQDSLYFFILDSYGVIYLQRILYEYDDELMMYDAGWWTYGGGTYMMKRANDV